MDSSITSSPTAYFRLNKQCKLKKRSIVLCFAMLIYGYSHAHEQTNPSFTKPSKAHDANSVVYVTDLNRRLSQCQLINNVIWNCNTVDANYLGPQYLAIDSRFNRLYITDNWASKILVCAIDKNSGSLSDCKDAGGTFNNPSGIAVNTQRSLLYVTDNSSLSKCNFDNQGLISNCSKQTINYDVAYSNFRLNAVGNTLYFASINTNSIIRCKINTKGDVSDCAPTGSNFYQPNGIDFDVMEQHAYISNAQNSSITVCKIKNKGTLDECQETNKLQVGWPNNVVMNKKSNVLYIPDNTGQPGSSMVSMCDITSGSGNPSNCGSADNYGDPGFINPTDMAFYPLY